MIVRILGEGQRDLPEAELDALNALDAVVTTAIEAGDEAGFTTALAALLERVRTAGKPLPDDELVPSDLVLPAADAQLDEVRELLGEDGLVPG
ncbi:MAG TPA: hypothetical protein VNE21_02010 [Mycobacteriales bacterium]|nr:hypothetical protein [Mycobacteriales bacterium]